MMLRKPSARPVYSAIAILFVTTLLSPGQVLSAAPADVSLLPRSATRAADSARPGSAVPFAPPVCWSSETWPTTTTHSHVFYISSANSLPNGKLTQVAYITKGGEDCAEAEVAINAHVNGQEVDTDRGTSAVTTWNMEGYWCGYQHGVADFWHIADMYTYWPFHEESWYHVQYDTDWQLYYCE